MPSEPYDLVVVGGGIHGAGIAQAGAAAGYSVLVLEQNDLASGTSSRSSKLIHGGLRYLESAQFGLVHECLHERTLLLKLAPELVTLQPFYIPVYPDTQRRPWQLRSGLALYSALGGLHQDTRFGLIPRSRWESLDGLKTEGLQKVFRYFDGQTDDAALTRAVMKSARELGAELVMPGEFIGAERREQCCMVHYRSTAGEQSCETRLLVNAAGPWVNRILARVTPTVSMLEVDLVQGTHIILDTTQQQGIYYVEAPQDKRAVFTIPWKGQLMVGTTESFYEGDPARVAPLAAEEQYLLDVLAHYFPRFQGTERDAITSSFAGLRVLPRIQSSAFSRPRDTIFHVDSPAQPRIATLYGGKLTAYRATAEKFIQRFASALPSRKAVASTRDLPLTPA